MFGSQSADVRKAVVDAIVAMYDQLGDWLRLQFAGLTAAQQKLVTIYINRATEAGGRWWGGGRRRGERGRRRPGARVPLAPRHAVAGTTRVAGTMRRDGPFHTFDIPRAKGD